MSDTDVRVLGREVEWRALNGLHAAGLSVRHADPFEDLREGWDLEVEVGSVSFRVDLTISRARFLEKRERCQNGCVIPVLLKSDLPEEELAREILRQVLATLPTGLVESLLSEVHALAGV